MTKKRNKRYQGDDAKRERPKVKKVIVEDKSNIRRWYDDNKNEIKIKAVQAAIVAIGAIIIWALISLF